MSLRTIIAVAALSVAFCAGWQASSTIHRVTALKATVAAQEAALREAERTAQIVREYHAEKDAIETALDDTARALQSLEGRDAPLSNHLRNAAKRLWP